MPSEYILTVAKIIHENKLKLKKNNETHEYNTRHKEDLKLPFHRLTTTQKYSDLWGVKVYNRLPDKMKNLPTRPFSNKLKSVLLRNAFYSMNEFLNYTFD